MCKVTATEFKKNLGKYFILCSSEDVIITNYGKIVGTLSNRKKSTWSEFRGILNEKDLDINDPKTAGILGKL